MKRWIYFLKKAKKALNTASHALQTQDYRASMYHSQEALEDLARAILVLNSKKITNLSLELEKINLDNNILLKNLIHARTKFGRIGFPEFSLKQPLFTQESCSQMLIVTQSCFSWALRTISSTTELEMTMLLNLI